MAYKDKVYFPGGNEHVPDIVNCVYRIWHRGKYMIAVAHALKGSMKTLHQNFGYASIHFDRVKTENLYYRLFEFILATPDRECTIEVVAQIDDLYDLLMYAHDCMASAKNDPNCLNTMCRPYIPQFQELSGKYGWMAAEPVNRYLNSIIEKI